MDLDTTSISTFNFLNLVTVSMNTFLILPFGHWSFCRLETSLRNYSCLTTGDTIMIAYNNKKYYIDVVETKPSPAVSIIETDCEVDFAQPLDYEEPEKQLPPAELEGCDSFIFCCLL